jgi:Secretion system C-terminal sorting domain
MSERPAFAPGMGKMQANNQKNNAIIYPNPAEGYFKLGLPSGRYDVTLTDLLGSVVKQVQVSDYEDISTDGIQSGVYQVTIRKQGEQAIFQTGKIVINKD